MGLGVWEIGLILVIVLIIFGAGKLPKVMKDLGKGVKSFKEGVNDLSDDESAEATPKLQANKKVKPKAKAKTKKA